MNKKQTYYLISRTLALDFVAGRVDQIANELPKKKEDWQKWVQTGSDHYVLQSLYLALQKNQMLSLLPDELCESLEHLYQLNFERNQKIISQAYEIKESLEGEGIGCVFMKGAGNIFDGLYRDIGERMLYDLDILVEEQNMVSAAEILMDDGYHTQKKFDPAAHLSTMHYPILVKEDCVAGVEIHRMPVHPGNLKALGTEDVFTTRKAASQEKEFWVMDDRKKIIHNFIHSQLMHDGHNHADVSLRDLYDLLLLSRREDVFDVFKDLKHYRQKSNTYTRLMYEVFDLPMPEKMKKTSKPSLFFVKHNLLFSMTRKQRRVYHLVFQVFKKYIALPFRTIWDKSSRNYVFSRLRRKEWYKQHLEAYKRKYFK